MVGNGGQEVKLGWIISETNVLYDQGLVKREKKHEHMRSIDFYSNELIYKQHGTK